MHALGVGLVGRSHSPLSLATLQAHSILSDISRRSEADSFVGGAADADGTGAPGDGNGSFTAMTPGQHSVASTAPHSARHAAYARARLSTPVNTTERSGVSTPSFASPPHTVDVQRTVPWLKRLRGTPGSDVSGGTPGSAASGSGALAAAAANLDSFASPPPRKAARKAYSSGGGTAAGATAAASPSSPGTAGAGAGVGAGATAAASFSSVASSPKFSSPPTSSTPIPARALLPTTPISNRLAAPRTAAFATTGSWRCNVLRQLCRICLDMCCGCVGVWVCGCQTKSAYWKSLRTLTTSQCLSSASSCSRLCSGCDYCASHLDALAATSPCLVVAHPQTGSGAVQLSQVFSQFQGGGDVALSMSQLRESLPDLGEAKISLLLETLVSRRLLRPFISGDDMYWRARKPQ